MKPLTVSHKLDIRRGNARLESNNIGVRRLACWLNDCIDSVSTPEDKDIVARPARDRIVAAAPIDHIMTSGAEDQFGLAGTVYVIDGFAEY